MKRAATCAFVLLCLISAGAQSPVSPPPGSLQPEVIGKGKALRQVLEKLYPPDRTYAVVVRQDLPTVSVKAREHGYPVEAGEDDWKGPGSMFRAKPAGNLAFGEVMKVETIDYGKDRVEMRLVSVDPHTIAVDPERPDRNRQEQVVTVLTIPHQAGIAELMPRIDAYIRLFASLDAARDYARTIRQPQPGQRFTLAVMRRDGVMVPIVSYDNGHWFRRWPLPAAERDVPLTMRDVPPDWWGIEGPPQGWTLWMPDGKPRPVQVKAPLGFGAHCLMNVGLSTNYHSPFPATPLDQHHYPKDGVATTGSVRVEPVDVITSADASWASFEPIITPHVNQLELRDLARMPWATVATRHFTPVKLEVMCIADGRRPDWETVYFEATKRYEPIDKSVPNPCGIVTFAHGFVQRQPNGIGLLDPGFDTVVTDCSMWNVEFRRPLGVIRVGGSPVWILEVSRWGGEHYELVEMRENQATTLITIPGGGCSR